ncbi:hypothetical protein ACFYXC_41325 [Streptomyces sp. NPDC002701]|uniref:hypothetical protein n=1 Tax=Streptomyces sp. NPDC002701 TaxID=3364661 RepID=UPI0036AB5927
MPVDAGGKGMETGQIVLPDGDEPVRKTLALALGQHDGEGADVSGERVENQIPSCRFSRFVSYGGTVTCGDRALSHAVS